MSPYLLDVNLQHTPDDYLTGKWRVESRVLSQADPTTPLAQATYLDLQAGRLLLESTQAASSGSWSVERDGLLSRPYLQLQLGLEQVVALVTRLRRSADGLYRTLVLYFQSGLELFLVYP